MPLPKYSIEPVNLSNVAVPREVESELEYISNVTLCNLMRQMSSICQLSGSMFEELTKELNGISERAIRLQKRIQDLSAEAQPLKAADEDCSLGASGMEMMQFQSRKPTSSQVLSKNTIPMSMRKFYEAAESAPPIHIMDLLRDDGRVGMKMYSDPSFFFDLWSHEMLLAPNKQKKIRKKKPKIKQGKTSKVIHGDNSKEGGIHIQQQGLGGIVIDEYTRNYNHASKANNQFNGVQELGYQDGYVTPAMPTGLFSQNQISDQYYFIQSGFSQSTTQLNNNTAISNLSEGTTSTPMPIPPRSEGMESMPQMRMLQTPVDLKMGSVDLPPAPMSSANGPQMSLGAAIRCTPIEDDITPSPPPPPMPSFSSQEDSLNHPGTPSQWLGAASNSLGSLISDLPLPDQRQSLGSSEDLLLPPPPAPNGAGHSSTNSPSPLVPVMSAATKSAPAAPPAPPPPPGVPVSTQDGPTASNPSQGPPADLLSAIRAGMVLKKVSDRTLPASAPGNTGTLSRNRDVQAIFDAVIRRRQMMKQNSDSDSDSDDDSDKSSGWSD